MYSVFGRIDSFFSFSLFQIENLQEQLKDKDKQLGNLRDRVKSLQTDSSNTDTALTTLEEALSEKVVRRDGVGVGHNWKEKTGLNK